MILQTQSRVLRDLLATESGESSHLEAVQDALILARAATSPPSSKNEQVSNDSTTLPIQNSIQ